MEANGILMMHGSSKTSKVQLLSAHSLDPVIGWTHKLRGISLHMRQTQ